MGQARNRERSWYRRRRRNFSRAIKGQGAAIRSRPRELRECGATDRIEDQMGALVVGQALDLGDDVLLGGRPPLRRGRGAHRL